MKFAGADDKAGSDEGEPGSDDGGDNGGVMGGRRPRMVSGPGGVVAVGGASRSPSGKLPANIGLERRGSDWGKSVMVSG